MPRDFPDMNSLKQSAKDHGFRQPNKDESEENYRTVLADHVFSKDPVESEEIRNSVGWDNFDIPQKNNMVSRMINNFNIVIEKSLVTLSGSLDSNNYKKLTTFIDDNISNFEKEVTFDLTDTYYINSRGIGVLIKIQKTFREEGKKLNIINVNQSTMDTVEAIGIIRLFDNFTGKED